MNGPLHTGVWQYTQAHTGDSVRGELIPAFCSAPIVFSFFARNQSGQPIVPYHTSQQ